LQLPPGKSSGRAISNNPKIQHKAQTFDSTSVSSSLISLLSYWIRQNKLDYTGFETIHHERREHSSFLFHLISSSFDPTRSDDNTTFN
jgi:hypothetical protein